MLDHFNNSFSLSVWGFFLTSRSLSTLIQTHHPWSVLRKSRLFSSFIWLCLVSLIDNANWVQDPILHIFISSADRPLCVTFFLSKARQWRYLCTVTAQHQHWLCCNVHSHIQWASVCFWGATAAAAALCVVMCWHMEADSYQTSPVWLSVPPVRLGWARSALESDLSPLGSKWMQSAGVCHSPLREYQDFAGWLLGSSDVESNSIFILCMSFVFLFRSCLHTCCSCSSPPALIYGLFHCTYWPRLHTFGLSAAFVFFLILYYPLYSSHLKTPALSAPLYLALLHLQGWMC